MGDFKLQKDNGSNLLTVTVPSISCGISSIKMEYSKKVTKSMIGSSGGSTILELVRDEKVILSCPINDGLHGLMVNDGLHQKYLDSDNALVKEAKRGDKLQLKSNIPRPKLVKGFKLKIVIIPDSIDKFMERHMVEIAQKCLPQIMKSFMEQVEKAGKLSSDQTLTYAKMESDKIKHRSHIWFIGLTWAAADLFLLKGWCTDYLHSQINTNIKNIKFSPDQKIVKKAISDVVGSKEFKKEIKDLTKLSSASRK